MHETSVFSFRIDFIFIRGVDELLCLKYGAGWNLKLEIYGRTAHLFSYSFRCGGLHVHVFWPKVASSGEAMEQMESRLPVV